MRMQVSLRRSCSLRPLLVVGVSFGVITVTARDLHVVSGGAASGTGTPEAPFSSIASALAVVQPGDTVRVGVGIHVGRVVVPVSGSADRPIVIRGERGVDGTWKAIIDSTTPLTVDWERAPEIGPGVYKTPFPGFEPRQILVDSRFIPRIWQDHMADGSGFKGLAHPADHVIKTDYEKQDIDYWDTMEAMFGTREGVVYLRFRNGDDPNQKTLRGAPAGGGVHIENQSHIVLRDLLIRGGENCVLISGPKATHNVVERCRLLNASNRVRITDGAAHNTIRENEMSIEFYARTCRTGAWGCAPVNGVVPYEFRLKQQFYRMYKLFFGPNATSDYGVRLYQVGPGNEVCHNQLYRGGQGISVNTGREVRIHHNMIRGFSSLGIICTLNRIEDVHVHENTVYDCNINLRIHHVNEANQPAPRSLYVYRNRFWNKPGVGTHIYFHYNAKPPIPPGDHPRIGIYHNTFVGGRCGISVSGWADELGGLRQTLVLNNILATGVGVWAARPFILGEGMTGMFDHNYLTGGFKTNHPEHDYTKAPWYGQQNVHRPDDTPWDATALPDFRVPASVTSLPTALDLSLPVELNGRQIEPLPGM
ncbi:MAG: hypothetical protein HON70_33450, partial [Lentisphaerae bacterium]|nr:hypothetical protein [Lentisphaerota bacterium]